MNATQTRSIVCTMAAGAGLAVGSATAGEIVYGVTDRAFLVSWDSADPTNIISGVAVTGLMQNESVQGLDLRPETGEFYAVGSFSNLYKINAASGAATLVGAGSFNPPLNGSSFGFDFNPTIDRIRNVSDANQNLVLNPFDGTSTQVTDLFYDVNDQNAGMDPNIVASAYSNNFKGAIESQLFGIDSGLDMLVKQANSAGTLTTVGMIGTDITDVASFDISGGTGIAYAAVTNATLDRTTFWTIDLDTGLGTMVGEVGGGSVITAMTVVPTPGALAIFGMAGAIATRRKRG